MEKNIVNYLRFSITDKCNLNCLYCRPLEKKEFVQHKDVLRYEEMVKIVDLFSKAGISKLRITGGEALIKKDIVNLISMFSKIKNINDIGLTTNAVKLLPLLYELKQSGLNRINISLDSLKKDKFRYITGFDCFEEVWESIKNILDLNMFPLKLNVVPLKGINDDEIIDFVELVFKYDLDVRFIEFFPTNKRNLRKKNLFVSNDVIKKIIEKKYGKFVFVSNVIGNGPAQYYKNKNSIGNIGFISGITEDFCSKCTRIRIDCKGRISPCLFSSTMYYDIKPLLNSKKDIELVKYIQNIISKKHLYTKKTVVYNDFEMSSLGG